MTLKIWEGKNRVLRWKNKTIKKEDLGEIL
jgi:hypothetical protein